MPSASSSSGSSPARPSSRSTGSSDSSASSCSRPSPAARHELKEYVIGVQVFGKEDSFDPRTDPIVRVQARRLRAKLVRYYREEGRADDDGQSSCRRVATRRSSSSATTPVLAKRSIAAALVSRNTVAVLPFADHSAERDLDYFCRGMREEIVHRLARFAVAADPRVGRAARDRRQRRDAALIISGSVRRSGDAAARHHSAGRRRQRLLPLVGVDGRDDRATCSPRRSASPQAIVQKLEPEFARGRRRDAARRPTENLAAHNLYLQGRYHLNQRTEEGLRKAVDFFEKALVEDAAVRAGAQRPGRRLRPAGALRRARARRRLDQGRLERRDGGDARRRLGRGAHVAGAREVDAGLGLGRRRARVPARHQPRSRATRRRTTGTRCRAWRRWAGSTKRWTRCCSRSRSIRSRRSSRATSRSSTSTGATSRPRSSSATTRSS